MEESLYVLSGCFYAGIAGTNSARRIVAFCLAVFNNRSFQRNWSFSYDFISYV